jgi:hypothetical protein
MLIVSKKIDFKTKSIISLMILRFGLDLISSNQFMKLCPKRICIDLKSTPAEIIFRKGYGNYLYQAPEVLTGKKVNEQALVWTFGLIMHYIFC